MPASRYSLPQDPSRKRRPAVPVTARRDLALFSLFPHTWSRKTTLPQSDRGSRNTERGQSVLYGPALIRYHRRYPGQGIVGAGAGLLSNSSLIVATCLARLFDRSQAITALRVTCTHPAKVHSQQPPVLTRCGGNPSGLPLPPPRWPSVRAWHQCFQRLHVGRITSSTIIR